MMFNHLTVGIGVRIKDPEEMATTYFSNSNPSDPRALLVIPRFMTTTEQVIHKKRPQERRLLDCGSREEE